MRRQHVAVALLTVALVASCSHANQTVAVKPVVSVATTAAEPTTTAAATTTTTATSVAPETTTTAAAVTTTATTEAPATTTTTAVVEKGPTEVKDDNVGVGKIEIPKLGVTEYMFEGIELSILDNGPGHWPGTAWPGQVGNMVIAGHRVSHTHPFLHINDLADGDEVFFTTGGKRYRYQVSGTEIVNPDAIWITDPTPTATATLFACHPPGSTTYRWVTRLVYSP
jgi:sortase A